MEKTTIAWSFEVMLMNESRLHSQILERLNQSESIDFCQLHRFSGD